MGSRATHWSTRTLAKELGISKDSVGRVWQAAGLKPHLSKSFKVSNDPQLAEKVVDIVGLYLAPPDTALVLSCDEKSSIQALDRTQKSLPLFYGRQQAIADYVTHHDQNPRGFQWTRSADEILAKITRARHVLDKTPSV